MSAQDQRAGSGVEDLIEEHMTLSYGRTKSQAGEAGLRSADEDIAMPDSTAQSGDTDLLASGSNDTPSAWGAAADTASAAARTNSSANHARDPMATEAGSSVQSSPPFLGSPRRPWTSYLPQLTEPPEHGSNSAPSHEYTESPSPTKTPLMTPYDLTSSSGKTRFSLYMGCDPPEAPPGSDVSPSRVPRSLPPNSPMTTQTTGSDMEATTIADESSETCNARTPTESRQRTQSPAIGPTTTFGSRTDTAYVRQDRRSLNQYRPGSIPPSMSPRPSAVQTREYQPRSRNSDRSILTGRRPEVMEHDPRAPFSSIVDRLAAVTDSINRGSQTHPNPSSADPPRRDIDRNAIVARYIRDTLWPKYCRRSFNTLDGTLFCALTSTMQNYDGTTRTAYPAPEDWVEQLQHQIGLLLDHGREINRDVIVNAMRQPAYQGQNPFTLLGNEVVWVVNRGTLRGTRRRELGLLLETVGIADQGEYWQPVERS